MKSKIEEFLYAKNINSIKRVQNIIFIRLRRHKRKINKRKKWRRKNQNYAAALTQNVRIKIGCL